MASIPGTWKLFYSWGCGSSYSTVNLTFNANGTWSGSDGYNGKWSLTEGVLLRNYTGSATVYGGNTAGNVIAGTMTTFAGSTGCWYLVKSGVTPLTAAKAKPSLDSAGNKPATKSASKKSSK